MKDLHAIGIGIQYSLEEGIKMLIYLQSLLCVSVFLVKLSAVESGPIIVNRVIDERSIEVISTLGSGPLLLQVQLQGLVDVKFGGKAVLESIFSSHRTVVLQQWGEVFEIDQERQCLNCVVFLASPSEGFEVTDKVNALKTLQGELLSSGMSEYDGFFKDRNPSLDNNLKLCVQAAIDSREDRGSKK